MPSLAAVVRLLSSFGLTTIILLFLCLLTVVGTYAQETLGLHGAQKKYFDAWFVVQEVIGPVRVPLPGGQLLLAVLAINLVVGGILRLKRSKNTVGILIAHLGIVLLLAAGFVKYYDGSDGYLALYEGEQANYFESHYEWELAITRALPDGRLEERLVPYEDLLGARGDRRRTFTAADLPFDLELSGFQRNSMVRPKGPMFEVDVPVVDGFYLEPRPDAVEAEQNLAGVYATAVEPGGEQRHEALLWGFESSPSSSYWAPFTFEIDGERWALDLRQKRFALPFSIQVDDFRAEFHPRTMIASTYESSITKYEGDVVQPQIIRMNEPLRHDDYVMYQSSYGPSNARPGQRMYTVFAVVRNPSDQWPKWACWVIFIGLAIHFVQKLGRHIRSEAKKAVA
ncbi:MAG: cytochrome c biogenesis protein ResB [Planctomycetota bacterium]